MLVPTDFVHQGHITRAQATDSCIIFEDSTEGVIAVGKSGMYSVGIRLQQKYTVLTLQIILVQHLLFRNEMSDFFIWYMVSIEVFSFIDAFLFS